MRHLPLAIPAVALLAACVPDTPPATDRPAAGVVTFMPVRSDGTGFCRVGYSVTYPANIAPHSRRITVSEPATGTTSSYDLPIPPLGPPRAFTEQGGMITFERLADATIMECNPDLTRRSLNVGPCTSGDCAAARFAPDPALATLRLEGRVQE